MPYCWLAVFFSVGYSWAGVSFLSCLSTLRADPHQSSTQPPSNHLRVYPQQGLWIPHCSLYAQKELNQSCTISFMPSSFASMVKPFPHLVNWGWRTAPTWFSITTFILESKITKQQLLKREEKQKDFWVTEKCIFKPFLVWEAVLQSSQSTQTLESESSRHQVSL